MVVEVVVKFKNDVEHFVAGENVAGTAEVTLPEKVPLGNVKLSFHCLGETKWPESHADPSLDHTGYVSYDKFQYLNVDLPFKESDVFAKAAPAGSKKVLIPFSYPIPKDKNLPSTMVSNHGFIQYYVEVEVKLENEVKTFTREVVVRSPVDKHLMIAVVGSTSKIVLLHSGTVSLTASLSRKGFAPGETISVFLDISNKSNAKLVPRISLEQVQIFMCGSSHKTIETALNVEPVVGSEIGPHSDVEELLELKAPANEALTITSTAISVKYFVHVTLDIPNSFDLHVNLPVIMTTKEVIAELQKVAKK